MSVGNLVLCKICCPNITGLRIIRVGVNNYKKLELIFILFNTLMIQTCYIGTAPPHTLKVGLSLLAPQLPLSDKYGMRVLSRTAAYIAAVTSQPLPPPPPPKNAVPQAPARLKSTAGSAAGRRSLIRTVSATILDSFSHCGTYCRSDVCRRAEYRAAPARGVFFC